MLLRTQRQRGSEAAKKLGLEHGRDTLPFRAERLMREQLIGVTVAWMLEHETKSSRRSAAFSGTERGHCRQSK